MKQNIKSGILSGCIILLFFSTLILYGRIQEGCLFNILFKSPIKLETLEQTKNLKSGDTVNLDVTHMDYLMTEYTTYSKNGHNLSYKENANYYYVTFSNSDLLNYEYRNVAIKLNPSDIDKAKKVYSFYGVVKDMDDEEKKNKKKVTWIQYILKY